ncbi:MAG TPA: CBS domain-containing protein [Gallionella sp.]|nr:CBS domain-containing protein [Gallionella sp.]
MPIGEICTREVVVASRDTSVLEAAQLMRQHHVGALVVADATDGKRKPVGLITDRDLVVEVMAPQVNPTSITVGDIMLQELSSIQENSGVFEAVQFMRAKGVRRLPVVDKQGWLIGIVSMDDLLALLAEEMNEMAGVISHEQSKETHTRH